MKSDIVKDKEAKLLALVCVVVLTSIGIILPLSSITKSTMHVFDTNNLKKCTFSIPIFLNIAHFSYLFFKILHFEHL